jgi:ABC-2 type transport system permease protein
MRNKFFATASLMRLNLRQNRMFTLVWILVPAVWVSLNIISTSVLFPTAQSLTDMAKTMTDPVVVAIHGPLLDISVAGFVTWRTKVFTVLLTGIFSIIYVVRHTRLSEEQGKRELLCSNCVGTLSPLLAAVLNMLLVNAASTVLSVFCMAALGLGLAGALAHCLSIFLAASFLGCVGGVMAQLFVSAAAARNASFGVLAALTGLHILWNANGVNGGIMLLSPMEWPLLIRPFAGDKFSLLLFAMLMTVLFAAVSLLLMDGRDTGAGAIPQRGGRASAKPWFKTPLALSWRLQKGLLFTWLSFFALFSYALGTSSELLSRSFSTADSLKGVIEKFGGVDRAFMSLMLYIFAIIISIYGVMSAGIMRAEEAERGETFLSLPVKKTDFCLSHLLFVFLGTGILALVTGSAVGLGAAVSTGIPEEFSRLFLEMLQKLPSIWVTGGLAVFFFGLLPRLMNAVSFGLLVLFVMIEVLWEQQSISAAVYGLSPFSYVHPANTVTPAALVTLCLVSGVFVLTGIYLYQRRDLSST